MRFDGTLALLAAGTTVSAITINVPLKSGAIKEDGLGPRGVTNYKRSNSTSSGVNVPLTDWFNRTDNQWYSTFSLGTPPQYFTALFDTGSPDLIVGSVNCKTCGNKTLFDPSASSTYLRSPGTPRIYDFSTAGNSIPMSEPEGATGFVVQDTLTWGNLTVANQEFVMCVTMADILDIMPIDGILGMGLPGVGGTSWYWHLVEDGQLDSPYYSFYIPAGDIDGGELTLGGIDETKYEGEINWTDCDSDASEDFGAYVIDQFAIYSDGELLNNGTGVTLPMGWAIMDTGTAFMQTPDYETAKNIYAQISSNITQIDPAGAWGAPCDELEAVAPDLTFTMGTVDSPVNVTIPKAYFNLGEYPGLSGICQALFNNPSDGIGGSWFYGDTAYWLVGSPLIKQYYTVWDGQGLKIGWGQLENGPGFS